MTKKSKLTSHTRRKRDEDEEIPRFPFRVCQEILEYWNPLTGLRGE